jgi:glycogen debranching enzyme
MSGPHAPLLSYETSSPVGIRHQGWKDSVAPIVFRDGRAAEPPIAICEVQAYAAEALDRLAALADGLQRDADAASRWRRSAGQLRAAIEERLWIDDLGWYAMGLDADGRQIDALPSTRGHVLGGGSGPRERAARIRDRLRSPQMSSGWGLRTLAADERAYSPIGYHTGTVWPHDTTLVATGLARHGFPEDAAGLIGELITAAARSGHRLPEALAGYDRDESVVPVRYPTACNPQAWTAAAPFQWLRVLLGLEVDDGRLLARPPVPLPDLGPLELAGVHAGGRRWVVRAEGADAHVEPIEGSGA